MSAMDAIVFDLDGVLWTSAQSHGAAFVSTLAGEGLDSPPYAELAGRRTDEAIAWILEGAGVEPVPDLVARLTAEKRRIARALLEADPPVRANTVAVVVELSERFSLGLASSASRGSVDTFLAATGLTGRFGVVLSGADVKAAKPDPEIYQRAIDALAVEPARTLVVEDAAAGVVAARAAGARVVGVVGTTDARTLVEAGATSTITDLDELLAWTS